MVSQVAKQLVVSISGRFDRFDRNVLGRFDLLPSANFVQYLENMFLDETQKHCQEDHHWNLFSHLALKRHFLEKLEKETHFWPFFWQLLPSNFRKKAHNGLKLSEKLLLNAF